MACKYYLNGRLFNSEMELDNFLINFSQEYKNSKDIVYLSDEQIKISSKSGIIALILDDHKRLTKGATPIQELYHDGEVLETYKDNTIGINKFISLYIGFSGDPILLAFEKEAFWESRFNSYKNGNFTEDEKDVYFTGDDLQKNDEINQWLDSKDFSLEAMNERFRKPMEYKWKKLQEAGIQFHAIMEQYFKIEGRNRMSTDQLQSIILSSMQSNNTYGEYVQDMMDSAINYAIKLENTLYQLFAKDPRDELLFYPELKIASRVLVPSEDLVLNGTIDLLVIDPKGGMHIIDYKTSLHDVNSFVTLKKDAYIYLLATYSRILEHYGFTGGLAKSMLIAPILFINWKKDDVKYLDPVDNQSHDWWRFESGKETLNYANDVFIDITNKALTNYFNKVSEYLPSPQTIILNSSEAFKLIKDTVSHWFPDYNPKSMEIENVMDWINQEGGLKYNKTDGIYTFKPERFSHVKGFEGKTEKEVVDKVTKWLSKILDERSSIFLVIKNNVKESIEQNTPKFELPSQKLYDRDASQEWLYLNLAKYCNKNKYSLVELPDLESIGILTFKNEKTLGLEFVRISSQNLKSRHYFKGSKNTSILGNFVKDITESKNNKSLAVASTYGNIELMEMMVAINNLASTFKKDTGAHIYSMKVINPFTGVGLSMTNEELLYNYTLLNKYYAVANDLILGKDSNIQFASKIQILKDRIIETLSLNNLELGRFGLRLDDARANLFNAVDTDVEKKTNIILNILRSLRESGHPFLAPTEYTDDVFLLVLNDALTALAYLKGINFRLQIKGTSKWLLESNFIAKGLSSTYLDNPGHLSSETLNLVARLTFEAYQNVRDDILKDKGTLETLVRNLKTDSKFSWLKDKHRDLYSDLFRRDPDTNLLQDGDLILKNPYKDDSLSTSQKEFIKFFLQKINEDRYASYLDLFESWIEKDDIRYFRIPLTRKKTSKSIFGLMDSAKKTFESFSFVKLDKIFSLENLKKKAENTVKDILNALDKNDSDKGESLADLFSMLNMFLESLRDSDREQVLNKVKEENKLSSFETDLEALLLRHKYAYSMKEHIDEITPIIQASYISIVFQGTEQNTKYKDDLDYLENYYKNKIKGEDITDPKLKNLNKFLSNLRKAAAMMTLGISPVMFVYQLMDGCWKDIRLVVTSPGETTDGKPIFTKDHMSKSFINVLGELMSGSKKTINNAIDELYGLNDKDMNIYYDKIKSDQYGFSSFLFHFASRPDYYNRLTIFQTLMRADGCWEAHSLDSNGNLIYDWTKDERFNLFALYWDRPNVLKGELLKKFNEQKALYYAMAELFVLEHTKDSKGNLFQYKRGLKPMALPKAYTTLQAESMKSICDNLYGYYSHERKSMIQATTAGAMWLLFKTYWSGKKNLYLESGGIKLRGHFELAKDGDTLLWERWNEETQSVEITTEETGVPHYQWVGDWEEGVVATLCRLYSTDNMKNILKDRHVLYDDSDYGKINRYNLRQAAFDITMWIIGALAVTPVMAMWLNQAHANTKESDSFGDAAIESMAKILSMSVRNSFMDINFMESITSPILSWDPVSITYTKKVTLNLVNTAFGDKDMFDFLISSTALGHLITPLIKMAQKNYNGD